MEFDENEARNKIQKRPIFQNGIVWHLAQISQVQDRNFLNLPSFLNSPSCLCRHAEHAAIVLININILINTTDHLCKVLGNKVLPMVCLVFTLTYWTLGLTLPTYGSSILDDDVSDCTFPV